MKMEYLAGRRAFLGIAAILGGLAALFGVAKSSAAAKPKEIPPQPEKSSAGYRLTEHIKKYYETARL